MPVYILLFATTSAVVLARARRYVLLKQFMDIDCDVMSFQVISVLFKEFDDNYSMTLEPSETWKMLQASEAYHDLLDQVREQSTPYDPVD